MNKVVIMPTDTVYGIGCGIYDLKARKRIYDIKNRSYDKPLAVLCADIKQIEEIVEVSSLAKKLIERFMPGPLTIILKAKPEVYEKSGYETIGVRIPKNDTAIRILRSNGPMTTTSVNESGEEPMNDASKIKKVYGKLVDEIYEESNFVSSNIASTVVDCSNNMLELVRLGEISLSELIKNI